MSHHEGTGQDVILFEYDLRGKQTPWAVGYDDCNSLLIYPRRFLWLSSLSERMVR